MTDTEILELAENYKFCCHDEDGIRDWKVTPSLILKFARAMYDEGYVQCSFDMGDENV